MAVALTGDAFFTYENLEKQIPIGFAINIADAVRSSKKILSHADIVVSSHDPKVL